MNSTYTMALRLLLFPVICTILMAGCKDDENALPEPDNLVKFEEHDVALEWMQLFIEVDRYTNQFRPGPVSRALAYINLAAYESAMPGMPDYKSLQNLYPGLSMPEPEEEEYHYPTVVNAVYANLIKRFIPSHLISANKQSELQFQILELEQAFNEEFRARVGGTIFDRSKLHGEEVANAMWLYASTDPFGHNAYEDPHPVGYAPPEGPGLWQPTPPDFTNALFPYWGKARTLAIEETDKLAVPPLEFHEDESSQFYVQALEVRNLGTNLEFTDQWIAEFWSDDYAGITFSPVARWISIASQVIQREKVDLETALYTYAKISIALNDAGVAAWHSKYIYNVERPVTYINRVMDAAWSPLVDTNPSFPAYPSGHATFGAAAAEVLSHIYGYSYGMTDYSHEDRSDFYGMPRTFDSFYEMAEENAYSRIPLGVHFRMDAEEGVRLGYKIGRKVNEMPFK